VRPLFVATAILLVACGPSGPLTLEPMQYDAVALHQRAIADSVTLVRPPQGGFVVFAGWEAHDVAEETVRVAGRIRALSSGAVLAEDVRVTRLVASGGTWTPDLASYFNVANIAVCPFDGLDDRGEQRFRLEIQIDEPRSGRSGVGARDVTLTCAQPDAAMQRLCACECAGNFRLGKCTM
jgi:hypothetical protein